MLPVSSLLLLYFFLVLIIYGAVVGVLFGWLGTALRRRRMRLPSRVYIDAAVGSSAVLLVFLFSLVIPIERNTVTTRHAGEVIATSTMSRFQYPFELGTLLAIIFPLIFEGFARRD